MAAGSSEREHWFSWRFPSPDCDDLNTILDELKITAKRILAKRSLISVEAQNAAKSSLYVISQTPITPIQQEIRDTYDREVAELQSLISCLELSSQAATEALLITIVGRLQRLKEAVMALRDAAKQQLAAAQDQELEALMGNFRDTWERLVARAAAAAAVGDCDGGGSARQVPWELQYKLLVSESHSQVEFEGAGITDAQGKLINVQECTVSGVIIQNWAFGEGTPRYHCLDSGEAITASCFGLVQQLIAIRRRHCLLSLTVEGRIETEHEQGPLEAAHRYLDELGIDENHWVLEHNIPTFLKFPVTGARTVAEAVASAFNSFANRPLFGTHALPGEPFRWRTYASVRDQVFDVALALRYVCALPAEHVGVGLCMAANRPEWMVGLFASLVNGFMAVGLMANWPLEELAYVCSDARLSCFFVDAQTLPKIRAAVRSLLSSGRAQQAWLVCVDPLDENADTTDEDEPRLHVVELVELVRRLDALRRGGQQLTTHTGVTREHGTSECTGSTCISSPDAVISLLYSSGSSGRPKGIVEQQSRWMVQLRRVSNHVPHVVLSYAPLAHGMDRGMIVDAFVNGGRVGFAHCAEGTSEFFEEIAVLQPAVFAAMPAFWTQLYTRCQQAEEEEKERQSQQQQQHDHRGQSALLDARAVLGRRIRVIATGGSHTPPDVFAWMQSTWASDDLVVSNSYGLSECPGVSQNGKVLDNVELQLAPVDLAGGESFSPDQQPPRGEILVRSPALTRGYWGLAQETADAFTSDGFFRTGDVGMLDEKNMLHIIDRVKNFCEIYVDGRSVWVSTSRIETSLKNMPIIHEAYVHGDRMESALVAVLSLRAQASEEQLLAEIRTELAALGFAPHEIPRAVIISQERWTVKSGLLLGIGKPNRRAIREAYQLQLSNVFLKLAEAE